MPKPAPYYCTGIAAVSTVNGKPYVDLQNDWIPTDALVKMSHRYINGDRHASVMHMRKSNGEVVKVGKVVASMVLTAAIQKSLHIDCGMEPWLVTMEIDNPAVAAAIKSGELDGLSIAGRGIQVPCEIEE